MQYFPNVHFKERVLKNTIWKLLKEARVYLTKPLDHKDIVSLKGYH